MQNMSLDQIVAQQPYPDYLPWWPMGEKFLTFMSIAIVDEWQKLGQGTERDVGEHVAHYIDIVYGTAARPQLVEEFIQATALATIRSGEFDALSYGFYRSAFEELAGRG